MKHVIEIIPATLAHVQELALKVNAEDAEEAVALGLKPHRALWRGWKNSILRRVALVDGEVSALWGCSGKLMGYVGCPWLVTSRKAREVSPHEFARIYRAEVREMLGLFPKLVNFVDDRYDAAKKMLRISGFTLDEPAPIGKLKRLFRRFHREA